MNERIAVIDLGTNTFHLLIAEGENKRIVYREKQPVKIGLGGINQSRITETAMMRALACIKNFKNTMVDWKVARVQALGTSAMRNALNGEELVRKIQEETGIEVKVISGELEAEYIYMGVRSAMDLGTEKSLIVDIGGGSVEFIIGDHSQAFWKQSFEIGAQRLLEIYQQHDPILATEVAQLDSFFETSLNTLVHAFEKYRPTALVGSSGTFDTLSEIYCLREGIDIASNSSETPLTVSAFHKIHDELISKDRDDRMKVPGMIEMRVDMIVVASCLVKFLIDRFQFKRIRVSSYSLKEGVLASDN